MLCARSKRNVRTQRTFSGKKPMGSTPPASPQPQPSERIYTDSPCDAAACNSRSLTPLTTSPLNTMTTPKTKTKESGVTHNKQRNRWIVRQTINGKRKQIGSFKTLAEANALVANTGNYSGFNTNTLFASHNENTPNPCRSQSDIDDSGDHVEKVSIGRNEAKAPTKEWSNIQEFHRWLDQQSATFWMAENGDRATLISQRGRIVLVEYLSKKGTVHYEVSKLIGSEYDFSESQINGSTSVFCTKREATKAFNLRAAA